MLQRSIHGVNRSPISDGKISQHKYLYTNLLHQIIQKTDAATQHEAVVHGLNRAPFATPWLLPLAILDTVVYSAEKSAIPPGTTRNTLYNQQL
jgi:hypothetical protein